MHRALVRTCLLASWALAMGCPQAQPDPRGEATLTLVGPYEGGAGHNFPGLAGVADLDDDLGTGQSDWINFESGGDWTPEDLALNDDLVTFVVPAAVFVGAEEGERFTLQLRGGASRIRIFHEGAQILGASDPDDVQEWDVPISEADLSFQVQFRSTLAQGSVVLERFDAEGAALDNDWSWLTASPLILNHHLQQTEHVWVVSIPGGGFYNNQQMIGVYDDVLGDQFTAVPGSTYFGDVWIQDEVQLGWMNSPESRIDLTIDSIRDRGLDDFPEDFLAGEDQAVDTWGDPGMANSMDSFGNLEISPPVSVDGVDYPFGRIYWGGDDFQHPTRDLTDFLDDQLVQEPFKPNTAWLCVGHIDEVTSTVPDPSSPRGFKFILGDTNAAWDLLDGLPEDLALPRFARGGDQGHGMANVGALVNNAALRMENEEIQEDWLDPMGEQFKEELGLTDEDILLMPSLFEAPQGCGGGKAALIPGMVNLIVTNRGEQSDVFLADPFTRDSDSAGQGQEDDVFIAHVRDMMPDTLDIHFVDNWAVYHMMLGEVHCGTNMMRTPAADWWAVADHLIGEAR